MRYVGSPKHKEPWQRGQSGTQCPRDLSIAPQVLLEQSVLQPDNQNVRWATDGRRAFIARRTLGDEWHGYPERFSKVPAAVLRQWETEGRVSRRAMRDDQRATMRERR